MLISRRQSTHQSVVDLAEEFLFLVGNTDHRELREAMEVVDDTGIFELVGLI